MLYYVLKCWYCFAVLYVFFTRTLLFSIVFFGKHNSGFHCLVLCLFVFCFLFVLCVWKCAVCIVFWGVLILFCTACVKYCVCCVSSVCFNTRLCILKKKTCFLGFRYCVCCILTCLLLCVWNCVFFVLLLFWYRVGLYCVFTFCVFFVLWFVLKTDVAKYWVCLQTCCDVV